jgi:hypothetical protein
MLQAVPLKAQSVALLDKDNLADIMPGVRDPEFPPPGFNNLFGFHDWKKR